MNNEMISLILIGILGYLIGSINTSLVVGKFYGIDVRKHGSGNAGLTNTLRTVGKLPAIIVTIGDLLKGIIACLLGKYMLGEQGLIIAGICVIAGHIWPVFFGFKGGKGVLTTLGVLLMISWQVGLALLAVFIIIVYFTKFVSLGSIVSSILLPIIYFAIEKDSFHIAFGMILALIIIIKHRSNIKRLFAGNENKISFKKSVTN